MDLRGKFIVFEGIDFSGKSTQARILAGRLRQVGFDVVLTREPGGTKIGEKLRSIILAVDDNYSLLPLSELLLFITSRAQLCAEVIRPALAAKKTVISSRYILSSLAYQGYGRGIDLELITQLNEAATEGLKPDVTFFIDVPVDIALARRRAKSDRIEREEASFYEAVRHGYFKAIKFVEAQYQSQRREDTTSDTRDIHSEPYTDLAFTLTEPGVNFLQKVRQGYLKLIRENPTVHVIDGSRSISEIASEVASWLGV